MKNILFSIALMATALTAPSCSLWNKVTEKLSPAQKTGTVAASGTTTATAVTTNKKGAPAVAATSATTTRKQTSGTKPTAAQLTGGRWEVASVGDVTIDVEEDVPYVEFARDGRFYASDGCNIINGDYVLRADGTLAFNHCLSTMKYCPEVEYSALIAAMFNDESTPGTDCKKIGQETYLYLKNAKGNTMLTLRRHNMEFLNGNWRITAAEGQKIDDEEANIFIDIAELKVHGNTGCNYFNGQIYIDPQRPNAIDFSNMGVTRMACPKGDQERHILVGLEETATAIAGKRENTVLFLDKNGKEMLTLKRIEADKD